MTEFLKGKTCLVTGGAQGIGWAISMCLAGCGADVFACDISRSHLDRAAAWVQSWPGRITLDACDVSDRNAVTKWVETARARTGRIDVLVNNAISSRWSAVTSSAVEDSQTTMRVGFEGMVFCTKAVLPGMLAAGSGHIVNIGSIMAKMVVFGGCADYSAVKAAVDNYTRVLQIELRGAPVRVSLIRPGLVGGTEFFRKQANPSLLPAALDFMPLSTPETVALSVIRTLRRPRRVTTVPRFYAVLAGLYTLSPSAAMWVASLGGASRRDMTTIGTWSPPRSRS